MFQNDLIDLAIGLVFVWLVLSLVISVLNEALVLGFRIRAKHLWLGVGRLVDPVRGQFGRRFWDTVLFLPLANVLRGRWQKVTDIRPSARASSADSNTAKLPESGVAAVDGSFLQKRVQEIYDGLAPMVSDVAKVGRRSKLTKIAADTFAEAIATIAKKVRSQDLIDAAERQKWPDERLARLRAAIPADPAAAVSLDDLLAWALGDDVTEAAKRELFGRKTAMSSADLILAARRANWPADRIDRLRAALPRDPSVEVDVKDLLAWPLGDGVTETDKRTLYLCARGPVTADDIAGFFEANPGLAQAIRNATSGLTGNVMGGVDAAKEVVANWFDREMEQLSALYRRNGRFLLAILAVPVVLFFQANTIGIISDLRSDVALRTAIANQAVATAGAGSLQDVVKAKCGQTGEASGELDSARVVQLAEERLDCAKSIVQDTQKTMLIVPDLDRIRTMDASDGGLSMWDWWEYEIRDWGWIGRLITLVALMFGAQFWFDILRRLVGIKTTLTKGGGGSAAG